MSNTPAALTPQQIIRKRAIGEPLYPGDRPGIHRHVINVLLENHIGALVRVINLFSARGFNLESVAVGITEDPSISRLTLVTTGDDRIVAQLIRQLNRLVDTLRVEDLTEEYFVEREICLLKVAYTEQNRPALMDILSIFNGRVVDITPSTMTFELAGPTDKINAFIHLMKQHTILETARSGRIALKRDFTETSNNQPSEP